VSHQFRVTVEDLETGEKSVVEIAAGDYILIPFAPCYLAHTNAYPGKGTVVLTIKDHRPQDAPREVTP
jgi:hypothetical protein